MSPAPINIFQNILKLVLYPKKTQKLTLAFLRAIKQGKIIELSFQDVLHFIVCKSHYKPITTISHNYMILDFHILKANIQRFLVFIFFLVICVTIMAGVKFHLFLSSPTIFLEIIEF